MVTIEPTSDDIGRHIEGKVRQDLDKIIMDEKFLANIRKAVPKGASGMYVLTEDIKLQRQA